MELSAEEVLDVVLELIGCGMILTVMELWLHHSAFIAMMERMI